MSKATNLHFVASPVVNWFLINKMAKSKRASKNVSSIDHGWAWMVCLAAHLCYTLSRGYTLSLGILYIEWKEYFNLTATSSSWLVSMPFLIASPTSLFIGVISAKLGIRRVSMVGAVITSAANILGSFVTDVWQLYLCGAMSGLGMVMMVPPAMIMVTQYFDKRYALANGIVVVGTNMGQIIFPPLFRLLIENYGWRGTMFIVGAIQMNGLAACALFRPLRTITVDVLDSNLELESRNPSQAVSGQVTSDESQVQNKTTGITEDEISKADDCSLRDEVFEDSSTEIADRITEGGDQHLDKAPSPSEGANVSKRVTSTDNVEADNEAELADNPSIISVFTHKLVMMTIIASSLYSMAVTTNLTHLPSRAKEAGWSDNQSAMLLTVYAITAMITRPSHGWFVDRKYIGAQKLQLIVIMGGAIVTCLNPVTDSYVFLVAYSAVLGCFFGIGTPLFIYNMKTFVRPEQVPATVSVIMATFFLFNGTGSVIAGKIFDATGNYVASFLVAGSMLLVSFLLFALVSLIKSYEDGTLKMPCSRLSHEGVSIEGRV